MNGIWDLKTAKKRHRVDTSLAEAIVTMFSVPKRAADLGCGPGYYCDILKAHNWPEVHGYEGTQGIKELGVYDDIMTIDLTKERYVDIDYSFVLCLEVGEHIPVEYEQVFMDNVSRFSTSGNLLLSWAIPGQGGKAHVNERDNDYIIQEFYKRKFKVDRRKTRELRKFASLKWFKNTLLVFRR